MSQTQQQKKRGLGKGLGSLIPQNQNDNKPVKTNREKQLPNRVVEININSISPNPHQPRKVFSENELNDLAASIKIHGVLQPITITSIGPNTYELIAGERRLQASKKAGLKMIPAIVKKADEKQKFELAIIENIQRHNLNPIEEALAYKKLVSEFNLSQEEAAKRVGKKRATVANTIRLLALPEQIQRAISEGKITAGHAKALLALDTQEKQVQYFNNIINLGLSVRETEETIKEVKTKKTNRVAKDAAVIDLEEKLQNKFGTKTKINLKKEGGDIVISFFSRDDLKSILDKLL